MPERPRVARTRSIVREDPLEESILAASSLVTVIRLCPGWLKQWSSVATWAYILSVYIGIRTLKFIVEITGTILGIWSIKIKGLL